MKAPNFKPIKVWAVYKKDENGIADNIFVSRKKALEYFSIVWKEAKLRYPNIPAHRLNMIKRNYKVIPVTLTISKKK